MTSQWPPTTAPSCVPTAGRLKARHSFSFARWRVRHPAHHPQARALPRAAARPNSRRRAKDRPRDGIAVHNEAQIIVETLEKSEILATDVRA